MTDESKDIISWKQTPYNRNMKYPDQLKFTTVVTDLLVRSKAEADIISRLEYYGVPYHYEEIQKIDNIPIAMDFTCLNLSTRQKIYWDHRGMLDNEAYIQKTLKCDAIFLNAGIVPWINLIVTTETKECPLEYPFLISNKSKCVDNCFNDTEFNLMFKNECFQKCPEGTASYIYRYNGEFTAQCVNADDFLSEKECDLDIKVSKLKYPEITEEILVEYAQEYVHEYPVANSYVTSYLSPDSDTMNKYLIVLYKLEKCPKQKVEGFIPIGLDMFILSKSLLNK